MTDGRAQCGFMGWELSLPLGLGSCSPPPSSEPSQARGPPRGKVVKLNVSCGSGQPGSKVNPADNQGLQGGCGGKGARREAGCTPAQTWEPLFTIATRQEQPEAPPRMNGQTKRGLTPTTEYYSALRIRRTSRISCQVKKERTSTVAYHRDPFAKCPQELNPQDRTQIRGRQGLGLWQKVLDFPLGRRPSSGTGSWPPLHITVHVQSATKGLHASPCPWAESPLRRRSSSRKGNGDATRLTEKVFSRTTGAILEITGVTSGVNPDNPSNVLRPGLEIESQPSSVASTAVAPRPRPQHQPPPLPGLAVFS